MTQATDAADLRTALRGSAARRRRERTVRTILLSAGLASVAISAFIVVTLIVDALRFLSAVDLSALNSAGWAPRRGLFDIPTLAHRDVPRVGHRDARGRPARPRQRDLPRRVRPPRDRGASSSRSSRSSPASRASCSASSRSRSSARTIVQPIFPQASGFNMLAAGIAVGILTIPLVASISEDAMHAVPRSPPRSLVRPRRAAAHDEHARRRSRRRSRASSRR